MWLAVAELSTSGDDDQPPLTEHHFDQLLKNTASAASELICT